jgi:pantetheine-phosphate adenylyltransferase
MVTAMYPGGFDPVTNGHLDIVERASKIFSDVVVSVASSRSGLFTTDERIELLKGATTHLPNVRVRSHTGLTVDAAGEEGATVLVRGLRALTDFTVEFDMALMNREMANTVDSVFLMTAVEHLYVSASRIRELASFGRDVSELVPAGVAEALRVKFPDR